MSEIEAKQVITKQRVADHGEVYTAKREVDAMLDLVKHETDRIESRFLEPACGTGNFLAEVLSRKLQVVESRYKKSQTEFECYSIAAVASLYGIDILEENVISCRRRLLEIYLSFYERLFKDKKNDCIKSIEFILEKNIVWGDALTFQTVANSPQPIVFSEWSFVSDSHIKRRDYSFEGLLIHAEIESLPLFSDMGDNVFIPTPIKSHPLKTYLDIAKSE